MYLFLASFVVVRECLAAALGARLAQSRTTAYRRGGTYLTGNEVTPIPGNFIIVMRLSELHTWTRRGRLRTAANDFLPPFRRVSSLAFHHGN